MVLAHTRVIYVIKYYYTRIVLLHCTFKYNACTARFSGLSKTHIKFKHSIIFYRGYYIMHYNNNTPCPADSKKNINKQIKIKKNLLDTGFGWDARNWVGYLGVINNKYVPERSSSWCVCVSFSFFRKN